MKKVLKIISVIFLAFILIIVIFFGYLTVGQKKVLNTKINDIDLSKISNGVYTGEFKGSRWSNTVKVTVKDNKITNIQFVKGQKFRIKEVEDELIDRVISKQSLNVDTVSGGTISSKAILKAIENAFEK